MSSMSRVLLVAIVVLSITACKSTSPKAAAAAGLSTVYTFGGGAGNFLAFVLKPIGTARDISIDKVNGESPEKYGDSRRIKLMPGHYEIAIRCDFSVDRQVITFTGSLSADVIANHIYEIDAHLPANRSLPCQPTIADKSEDRR
jgi:hypothetical protein